MIESIESFIGKRELSVSEAMTKIESNGFRILFLIDEQNRLVGCVTDGDIRRFLLAGGGMNSSVYNASNKNPKVASDISEARRICKEMGLDVVPVVSEQNIITELYTGDKKVKNKKYDPICIPVVINAGGRGTRLDPFTKVLPKPLIPVGEYPIIELIMQEYRAYKCDEFHIIVNYKKDLMKAYFHDNENHYNITWYDEDKPLGTGGGLRLLRGKMEDTFFFSNCDALLTANYSSMFKFHKECGNAITMIGAYKNINIPYGVIEMGKNGTIESMKEKPHMSILTNTGIYIVEPEVIDDIEDDEAVGFPDIVEREKRKGRKVAVFPITENDWMDMGQLPELEKMRVKLYGE